jgi:hypothetical protein
MRALSTAHRMMRHTVAFRPKPPLGISHGREVLAAARVLAPGARVRRFQGVAQVDRHTPVILRFCKEFACGGDSLWYPEHSAHVPFVLERSRLQEEFMGINSEPWTETLAAQPTVAAGSMGHS